MKKTILALAIAFIASATISSCKKDDIKPDNPLTGLYKCSRVSHYVTTPPDNVPDTIIHDLEYTNEEAYYLRFSEVNGNSVDITQYIYDHQMYGKDTVIGPIDCKISGNELILPVSINPDNAKYFYELKDDKLKLTVLSYHDNSKYSTVSTFDKVSNLPTINSDNGCPTVQCSATAVSTGNRCQRMTTNCNGRCWQHQ
jgi:hypothetical protein